MEERCGSGFKGLLKWLSVQLCGFSFEDTTCRKCQNDQGRSASFVLGTWRRLDTILCKECAWPGVRTYNDWLEEGMEMFSGLGIEPEAPAPESIRERVFRGSFLDDLIDKPDKGVCCGCWKNQGEEVKVTLHARRRQSWHYLCPECMKIFRLVLFAWLPVPAAGSVRLLERGS